jgi:hypothetical protein
MSHRPEDQPKDPTAEERLQLKKKRLSIRPGVPLSLEDAADVEDATPITPEIRSNVDRLAAALKLYLKASRSLVEGRYAELRDYVPQHMTQACKPTAFLLDDGVIVRYDLVENPETKVGAAVISGSVTEWAPRLSENVVYCPPDATGFDPGDGGLKLNLLARPVGGVDKPMSSIRIAIVAGIGATQLHKQPSNRPIPIVSVHNEFDIVLVCETMPADGRSAQPFLVRNKIRFPVGWRTFEVYPAFNPDIWNPDTAALAAEADLLAAVARRNLEDAHYAALDPHVEARRRMRELLQQLEQYLDGPEEPLHQFIRQHPELLSPTHIRVWSKLAIGKRVTDFVFREPAMDYLLVELEKASHKLFREDGQPREPLVHAMDQVMDWRRYIEDHRGMVQQELGLDGISVNPRTMVVIGRRGSLSPDHERKLVAMENATPRLRILTYDDVLTTARAAAENMLGPLWDPGSNAQVYFLPAK